MVIRGSAKYINYLKGSSLLSLDTVWIYKDHGFLVDQSYGYGKAMELPDRSLFITYLATGWHRTADAQSNAIRCIRLRLRPDYSGIDLLPAPNR